MNVAYPIMVRPDTTSQTSSPRSKILLTTSSPLVDNLFAKKNRYWLLGGGGAAIVLFFATLLFMVIGKHQKASALESLRDGIAMLQNGKAEEAILPLEKVKTHFRSGDEVQLAEFYLFEAYSQTGKEDKAKTLSEKMHRSGKDSGYLSQLLFLSQGRNAEKWNDLQAARKAYEEATTFEGPFSGDALLALARVAEASGDTSATVTAREKYLLSYPNSPLADILKQKSSK